MRAVRWAITAGVLVNVAAVGLAAWLMRRYEAAGVHGDWDDISIGGGLIGLAWVTTGAVLAWLRPRNTVGWLLVAVGTFQSLSVALAAYGTFGVAVASPAWPLARWSAWLGSALWVPGLLPLASVLPAVYPNGGLPGPRWRWPVAASVSGIVALTLAALADQSAYADVAPGPSPLSIAAPAALSMVYVGAALALVVGGTVCIWVMSFVRMWRARAPERQQLAWLLLGVVPIFILIAAGPAVPELAAAAMAYLIPVAIGVGVFRYNLLGIEAILRRGLVYGALASFITAVYVTIVVGIGSLVGRGDRPNLALSIAATAIVAVAFQPVRDRVQRLANRLVYGDRATPYEVLSNFADRMGGTYDAADLLPMMARTVGQGVGASRVDVWLRIGSNLVREASWRSVAAGPAQTVQPVSVGDMSDLTGDRVVPIRHHGELLGAITVVKPAAEPITPAEDTLLDDVAAQAGLVLRNLRLIEDLRGSRQRLVSAQDEERRRLERNLHDGAQQSLVSVALMIRMVRSRLGAGSENVAETLGQASEQLGLAIDELRELARGIHPAILTERGLGPALTSLAERSPVPVALHYHLDDRPSATVEGSLYFVVAEALTNAAKYAAASEVTVTVAGSDDDLTLEVKDDGVGGADLQHGSGLRGLADRVAAVDGILEIDSPPGHGTRLSCRFPLRRTPSASVPTSARPGGLEPLTH